MFIETLKAIFLGIVQGITEWLPVSSTGHLILIDEFLKLGYGDGFTNMFFVVVQLGSILAVVVLFFGKLFPFLPSKSREERRETITLWFKIAVASIPLGVIGFLFEDKIDELFYNTRTIGIMLILYGVFFILFENRKYRPKIKSLKDIDYKTSFLIGFFQMLALIPGTSRSGATILGASLLGTSRPVAAEFSFFLAIPAMVAASGLKVIKYAAAFTGPEILVLSVGTFTAFVVSLFSLRFLLNYIKRRGFKVFGYYRIILGLLVLLYFR